MRGCLYCCTEFLTRVLVHSHPYCLCAVCKEMFGGRQMVSKQPQVVTADKIPVCPCTLPSPCSVPPSTRHLNCAQCCDIQCCSEQLSPSHFHCNSSKGGEDEHCFLTSNGLVAQIFPRPGTHIRKPFHLEKKPQSGTSLIPWNKSSVLNSSPDLPLLLSWSSSFTKCLGKVSRTKSDHPFCLY